MDTKDPVIKMLLDRIAGLEKIVRDRKAPSAPRQENLPGLDYRPGEIGAAIARKPVNWGNAVAVWEALWSLFNSEPFSTVDVGRFIVEIRRRMSTAIQPPTIYRILSDLVKAGAATRSGRRYALVEPTDPVREAVWEIRGKKRSCAIRRRPAITYHP